MLQLKVFYNIPQDDRCEVIFTEQAIETFEDLMQVIRAKIQSLEFIPDAELRVQYTDDENTLITLRANDSFLDAWRCALNVAGTAFRRLKINITWQPKSTPELISAKRQEIREGSHRETGGESRRKLKFGENISEQPFSFPTSTSQTAKSDASLFDSSHCSTRSSIPEPAETRRIDPLSSPPRKQQRLVTCDPPELGALNTAPPSKYMSPLDLLISDKTKEVTEEKEKVMEKEKEVQELSAKYGKQAGIDYSKPACTNCHRRERHNRVNCPYKAHPCQSAEICGDLNKHKDEKDILSRAVNELNTAKKSLEKLQSGLSTKIALKNQTTNSFSSVMRSRLINECKPRYLTSQGFENWRQVNMDLKKLESHFKGKIPSADVSLLEALTEYDNKISLGQFNQKAQHQGNPVRTLWELKGIEWPSQSPEPLQRKPIASSHSNVTFSSPLFTRTQLEPLTVEEEEEQLAAALKESTTLRTEARTNASETITRTLSVGESDYEIERTQLNDAANALLNLSELKNPK